MKIEKTLSIIKPDMVKKNKIGKIIDIFESHNFKIVKIKMVKLDKEKAEKFYFIHRDKPFFKDLINFMISGPIVVQVLERQNAILKNREIMGHTNPKLAEK